MWSRITVWARLVNRLFTWSDLNSNYLISCPVCRSARIWRLCSSALRRYQRQRRVNFRCQKTSRAYLTIWAPTRSQTAHHVKTNSVSRPLQWNYSRMTLLGQWWSCWNSSTHLRSRWWIQVQARKHLHFRARPSLSRSRLYKPRKYHQRQLAQLCISLGALCRPTGRVCKRAIGASCKATTARINRLLISQMSVIQTSNCLSSCQRAQAKTDKWASLRSSSLAKSYLRNKCM